jgi:hypothetical protein
MQISAELITFIVRKEPSHHANSILHGATHIRFEGVSLRIFVGEKLLQFSTLNGT